MLKISDITYSVEGRTLLEHTSVTIPTGHKVGLVGRNGTGKTTLFKIIRGEMILDTGTISLPRGWKIGGVSQEAPGNEVSLIDTVLRADSEREALLAEADSATDPMRIAEVQTRLADIEAWSAEARASTILKGLGFTDEEQRMPCSAFSGGWRMRVALAAVLFSEPDLLLLDEPTNYLDLEGALWRLSMLMAIANPIDLVREYVEGNTTGWRVATRLGGAAICHVLLILACVPGQGPGHHPSRTNWHRDCVGRILVISI